MTESKSSDPIAEEDNLTGLPWPRTWKGAYLFVTVHFVVWIVLLILLQELCR